MAKVVHGFIDGTDNQYYKIGSDYCGVLEEKLIKMGYVEGEDTSANLSELTLRELKEKADILGVEYKKAVKKADLIDLIEG